MEQIVILENIRSAHNVGSIFRTSDGAGVSRIYLCGYTPAPVDRFDRVVPEIQKTSLGASDLVSWERADDVADIIRTLQTNCITFVAVEQTPEAIPLTDFTPPERVAYLFGNEVDGVQPTTLALADQVVEIPMVGQKESLNVSVAAGIVLFNR